MKLLIVEDELPLLESIQSYFTQEGNLCESATSFSMASEKLALYNYDCILLDLGLPDGDGLELLKKLKSSNNIAGVLIISAKNSLDDKLDGLNFGADDYLVKPFHLSELMARVSAIIRRKHFDGDNIIQFNEIQINTSAKTVIVNETVLTLTKKEFDLLIYFLANKGKVVSKNAIAEHLWGDEMDTADNFDFIYTHIKNLRKKLLEAGATDYMHSVYGVGYKFSAS